MGYLPRQLTEPDTSIHQACKTAPSKHLSTPLSVTFNSLSPETLHVNPVAASSSPCLFHPPPSSLLNNPAAKTQFSQSTHECRSIGDSAPGNTHVFFFLVVEFQSIQRVLRRRAVGAEDWMGVFVVAGCEICCSVFAHLFSGGKGGLVGWWRVLRDEGGFVGGVLGSALMGIC